MKCNKMTNVKLWIKIQLIKGSTKKNSALQTLLILEIHLNSKRNNISKVVVYIRKHQEPPPTIQAKRSFYL